MIALLPGARFVDLGPDGGPYDETSNPKVCWHTTEGGSLAGAEAAYRPYPPHLGYDPRIRDLRQYVRLNRHSYSLRGAESDDEYVIQIEVVGRAAETLGWPDTWYRNIGEDLVRPLRELLGVPDQHLRFYGPNEGIVLASRHSPIRLSDAALRAFSGHIGHQHAPDPDEHWDPGGFLIDRAINHSHHGQPSPQEDDDMDLRIPLHPTTDPASKAFAALALPGPARDETSGHAGSKLKLTTGWGQQFKVRVWFLGEGDKRFLGVAGGTGHTYTVTSDNPGRAPIPDGTVAVHAEWTSAEPTHPGDLRVVFVPL